MDANVFIGVICLELHLPEAGSLKGKRSHTRSLVQRIKSRHQVLMVEVEHQNLYQRAGFAICALSSDASELEAKLQRVRNTVDETWAGHILEWDQEILQL